VELIRDIDACRSALDWRRGKRRVGMVVLRGELHPGKAALIKACRGEADLSVACFYPKRWLRATSDENLEEEPATLQQLTGELEALKIDVLFAPTAAALFPGGFASTARVTLPALEDTPMASAAEIEALATMTTKLLNIICPDKLFVGEKDYVACRVCETVIRDLGQATEPSEVGIIREADGIPAAAALEHLSLDERRRAAILQQTLQDMQHAIENGAKGFRKLEQTARLALTSAGLAVDYVLVRDAHTLQEPDAATTELRVLAAAELGLARLVDNLAVSL
jgi:pantoate--beta-alanine ligase